MMSGIKINWNPYCFCWEFWVNGKVLRCDESEYDETYEEARKLEK